MAEAKYMVVKLPHVSEAEDAMQNDALTSISSEESYRRFFESEIIGNPPGGKLAAYVHPRKLITEDEAYRNYQVLAESPVVYILVLRQSESMKQRGWLKKAIGDKSADRFGFYKQDYIIYIGETNDIVRRTNQHLNAPRHMSEAELEDPYEDVAARIDERTKADRVIQTAVKDKLPILQYVIWNTYFTKSMTLDMEHKFIDYSLALNNAFTLNKRGNPQRNYYMAEEKDAVCSNVWRQLSLSNPELFKPEADIWNSELYKVSPFHSLGEEQSEVVNKICDTINRLLKCEPICEEALSDKTTSDHRLVILGGASGTGKSIVLSTLFVRLSESLREKDPTDDGYGIRPNNKVCLIVNQDQQVALYTNLAKRIGLMRSNKESDACIYKATPFLNAVDSGKRDAPDVALVDEAHLLRMTSHRSYGSKFYGNQLYDILLRAKVVIAVLDPIQVMRKGQIWPQETLHALFPSDNDEVSSQISYIGPIEMHNNGNTRKSRDVFHSYKAMLTEQFRIDAGEEIIAWIDRLSDLEAEGFTDIPPDTKDRRKGNHRPFDLKVFRSPIKMAEAVDKQRDRLRKTPEFNNCRHGEDAAPLCRLLATYDWGYDTAAGEGYVELFGTGAPNEQWLMPVNGKPPKEYSGKQEDKFSRKWNYTDSRNDGRAVWSTDKAADEEVGSYFSVQGFDLNYAGVIIGPSITYRNGHIVVDKSMSKDGDVFGDKADQLIIQQLKVLLRRSIHGLYLFAVDSELQSALETAARNADKLVE